MKYWGDFVNIKRFIVFFIIPIVIILLLVLNAQLAAQKYKNTGMDMVQYRAEITSGIKELTVYPGEEKLISVRIKNSGTMVWMSEGKNPIVLSYHILSSGGEVFLYDGERTLLPGGLRSGESVTVKAKVVSPEKLGEYYLEFDMVHEGVTWFANKGSRTLKIKLKVVEK